MRPQKLADFNGQSKVVRQMDVIIRSANARAMPCDHILFHGQPGLGKTTLAQIVAKEMETECMVTAGQAFSRSGDLAAILSALNEKDVLFIDEIHQLNLKCQELLYTAMEDGVIDILIGKGITAKSIRIDINPFTLIGATTMPDKLSRPLTDRFIHNFKLIAYSDKQVNHLIRSSLDNFNLCLTDDAIDLLVGVAKGTPRIVLNLLKKIRDHFLLSDKSTFSRQEIQDIFQQLGIDKFGLNATERALLKTLYDSDHPLGLNLLAASLNENPASLESYYEPYLISLGFISRSHKGRHLTGKGVDYVRTNINVYE